MSITDDGEGPEDDRVGYKHPPKQYRFQKGQKPPPRKKRQSDDASDVTSIFWTVMQERRRVVINNKARWATTAELLARRSYIEAEKGSSTLQKLLNDILLQKDTDDPGFDVEYDWGTPPPP